MNPTTVSDEGPNPSGLCMCGCGKTTSIAARNKASLGHVKGKHVRFVYGHGATLRIIDGKKRCSRCKVEKYPTEFYKDRTQRTGFSSLCKLCQQNHQRNYSYSPESGRRHRLKYKFGVSPEEVRRISEIQGNVCAICRQPETKVIRGKPVSLAVDHNHRTGSIRGLLCHACNAGIGLLKDSPELLMAAVAYLSPHEAHSVRVHQGVTVGVEE